jgi:hypothetical protein
MVLHTESFEKSLPAIFERTKEEIMAEVVKDLMLAHILGIIKEQQNPQTGAKFDAIGVPDDTFGDIQWKELGKGFADSWESLGQNEALANLLQNLVKKELSVKAKSNDQKAELRKALGQFLQQVILPSPLCENNQFNPNYPKFRNWAVEITQNELKDL